MSAKWTKPYCGVSHLTHGQIQCDVEVHGPDFVKAFMLILSSPHPFTPVAEEWFSGPEAESAAKEWCEGKMKVVIGG